MNYGWPEGNWEQIFKKHFMKLADLASETGAAVIASPRGVHFGNEVLSFHRVGHLNAGDVLPALLITKTDPHYFRETGAIEGPADGGLNELLVIPLKGFCTTEDDFVATIEKIFFDLRSGAELKDFEVAQHDVKNRPTRKYFERAGEAIELKPNFFSLGVDLRKIFDWT